MHQNTGTGAIASTNLTLAIPAPGFYALGAFIDAPTLTAGSIGLAVSVPRRSNLNVSTSGALTTAESGAPVYLIPGDVVSYTVNPNGAGNSSTAPWSVGMSVTAAFELAS